MKNRTRGIKMFPEARISWENLPAKGLLRPREVAELFGESRSSIYGRNSRGELDDCLIRIGRSVRIHPGKLREKIERQIGAHTRPAA
jgi:predicted DNA-binding transcriptional regulator AlpA